MACEDGVSASSVASHNDADASSDPDDSGKAAPHQHGGCHGHHTMILTGAAVHGAHLAIDGPIMPREIAGPMRSEEHTSELQSLMRISYAVFCLKKNT